MNRVLSRSDAKSTGLSQELYTQDTQRTHPQQNQDPPKLQ